MLAIKRALRIPGTIHRAVARMLDHDATNLAQSAAYSAIVALFPALIVAAALIALLPDVNAFKIEAGGFFDEVLPPNVFPLLTSYFVGSPTGPNGQPHTTQALVAAMIVSLIGGSSTIATLMEGLHRAAGVPFRCWGFWQKRARALLLVPLSLLPLAVASVLVVFGRFITEWTAEHLVVEARPAFFGIALTLRWTISLAGVVGLTALIYHLGVPQAERATPRQNWSETLPGAIVATAMWFISTLIFGWYVTRVANYSAVYGSLGAGIALLFWLNLVFLSVLFGAEFNEQFLR
jgi:membrane protein